MKFKFALSLLFAGALSMSAQQNYKDGIEYFKADKFEEAKFILNQTFNESGTNKAEANYYLGQIAVNEGDLAQATQYFRNGISANGDYANNYVGLGAVDLKKGDKKAAEEQFKIAKNLDKKNPVLLVDIARAYFNADPVKYQKEIESYLNDARKADKKNLSPAIFILEGDMKDDPGDAAGQYEMATTFDKNNEYPEAYVKYAQVYFKINPRFSIDKLKELLVKQPNSALAQRELAEKYYENNQYTMAAQAYGDYIRNKNHLQRDEQRYVGLLNFAQEYQKSFDLAEKILKQDPGNIYMQRMLFLNQQKLGNNAEAVKYAKQFFANPNGEGNYIPSDYSYYGEVLFATGDTLNAIEAYEKAYQLQPENPERLKDLSQMYSDAKQYEKSLQLFEQYIENNPNVDVNDKLSLARRYNNALTTETDAAKKQHYADKALQYVNEVSEVAPNNFSVANLKAAIMLNRNNLQVNQDIIDAFLSATAILDKDPENKVSHKSDYTRIYNAVGNYYNQQADKENALKYWNMSLEIDPSQESLRNFLQSIQ